MTRRRAGGGGAGATRLTLAVVVIRIWTLGAGFAVMSLAAWLLSPSDLGSFALLQSALTVGAAVALGGADRFLVREGPTRIADGDVVAARHVLRFAGRWSIGLLALSTAVLAAYLFLGAEFTGWMTLAGVATFPVLVALRFAASALRGLGAVWEAQLPDCVMWTLFAVVCAVLIAGDGTSDYDEMLVVFAACCVAGCAFGWVRFRAVIGGLQRRFASVAAGALHAPDAARRSIRVFAFLGGVQVLNRQVDVFIVDFVTTRSEVGSYALARRGSEFVGLGLLGVTQVLAPRMAVAWHRRDRAELSSLLDGGARTATLVTLGLAVPVAVLGPFLIPALLGDAYADVYGLTMLLMLNQIASATVGAVGLAMNMMGQERHTATTAAWGVVATVVAGLVLGRWWGAAGVGVASVLGTVVWNLLLRRKLRDELGMTPNVFRAPRELAVEEQSGV